MKTNHIIKALFLGLFSLLAVIAYADKEKVIQVFKNGEIIQEFIASEIDYIEINDVIPVPENVNAVVSTKEITITWNEVEGATYNVYRSSDDIEYVLLASDLTETKYTDKDPLKGSNYYRVTAVIDDRESKYNQSIAANYAESSLPSGIYLGINGFSKGIQVYPIGHLSDENAAAYGSFINSLTATEAHTWLYYTVDKSIDKLQETQLPKDLSEVAIVTFTDGLDIGSLDEKDEEELHKYLSTSEYREALHTRLTEEKVSDIDISAYTIGIIAGKGSSLATFKKNMTSLATSPSNVFEVSNIENLNQIFEQVANSLSETKYVQRFVLSISGQSHNEKCKFTFDDVSSHSASKLYIEGTYDRQTKSLKDITYVGLTSSSGPVVQGVYDENEGKYNFTFENLQANDGNLISTDHVNHWFTDEGIWQDVDDEFFFSPDDASIQKIKRSAAIMLNLDCSKSMNGEKFAKLQEAANSFVQKLAENSVDPSEVSSVSLNKTKLTLKAGQGEQLSATVLPETAKLKTVTWSSSNTNIASVDDNGYVTAVGAGTTTITVTTKDGGLTATCQVNVLNIPAPENLVASRTDGVIELTWNAVENCVYNVYRSQNNVTYTLVAQSVEQNTYTDPSPLTGTNYYRVTALTDGLEGDYSAVSVVFAPAPSGLSLNKNTSSLILRWVAVPGATYSVYHSIDNVSYTLLAANVSTTSYSHQNPADGVNYYKVKSIIADAESVWSAEVHAVYVAPPTFSSIVIENKKVVLKWETAEGTTYDLYKSAEANTTKATLCASGITGGTYTDANPLAGMNYYYLIARTSLAESGYSTPGHIEYNFINGYEFVDLGLPSGIKWATVNVGATNSGGAGSYFAWGEVNEKSSYNQSNSITTNNTSIRFIGGSASTDAATAKWGTGWRMPHVEDFQELLDKCTWTWTTVNGSNGYLIKGPNGKTIFLPVTGCMLESNKQSTTGGYYWSSSYYDKNTAWRLNFNSSDKQTANNYKLAGLPVRPVSD